MLLLCYSNGSLTRQTLRNRILGSSSTWNDFNTYLNKSKPGNNNIIQFTFLENEITPTLKKTGIIRFDGKNEEMKEEKEKEKGKNEEEEEEKEEKKKSSYIRGCIEGQMMSLQTYSKRLGLERVKKIVASGGGSVNRELLQVMADVFQVEVYTQKVELVGAERSEKKDEVGETLNNTAALGAAYRAAEVYNHRNSSSASTSSASSSSSSSSTSSSTSPVYRVALHLSCRPREELATVYQLLSGRYEQLEKQVIERLQ